MTGWQWHQLDHMQIVYTPLQADNHTTNNHWTNSNDQSWFFLQWNVYFPACGTSVSSWQLLDKLERPELVFPAVESVFADDPGGEWCLHVDIKYQVRLKLVLNSVADNHPVLLRVCRLKWTHRCRFAGCSRTTETYRIRLKKYSLPPVTDVIQWPPSDFVHKKMLSRKFTFFKMKSTSFLLAGNITSAIQKQKQLSNWKKCGSQSGTAYPRNQWQDCEVL